MNNQNNSENSVASSLVHKGLLPDRDGLSIFIWPGCNFRDLAVLDNQDNVEKVVATSPGYIEHGDQYSSDNLFRRSKKSHDLAEDFYDEYGEGVFDFEYGHAVMEDLSVAGTLTDDEKIEKIRRLGKTSNKLLKHGGRAVYNLNGVSQGIVNEHEGENFTVLDYQRGHGALFQDVLKGDYFEKVTWTDEIDGENYHEDTVFVIADNPIY